MLNSQIFNSCENSWLPLGQGKREKNGVSSRKGAIAVIDWGLFQEKGEIILKAVFFSELRQNSNRANGRIFDILSN